MKKGKKMKVVKLTAKAVDPDIVDVLEDMLDKVKSGEIKAIALAASTHTNEVYTSRAGEQGLALVGGLEFVKSRVVRGL